MKPAQLLLAYQRLIEKERELRDKIERVESLLAVNPNVVAAEEGLERVRAEQQAIQLRLRDSDRDREAHRTRLRSREKELMSGRIRNPTELMQMNQEVQHMKASFAEEEDAQLRLMEEGELAEAAVREASDQLDEARSRHAGDEPGLRQDLEAWQTELASVKGDSDAIWAQVPSAAQNAYLRVRAHPPVAEVDRNQCLACRVTVTSSGMQVLRKGDEIVHCDNCGRILVIA
ncbi:MAG TPA: C4-type zinc ribbon domain-containing protein [Candidatus Limnocylindrales bacterium]|nr:C4-type zinc ribbon domain-containing protein [Candidatus Limnocylindrales bacterium]